MDLGELKGGLDWFKTRCFVIIIHFKTSVLSGKLQYSRKLRMYLCREGRVFLIISAGTEEFLGGISAGTEQGKN